MVMFANAYEDNIDWESIYSSCHKVHIETFAAALLQIACQYLTLARIPGPFAEIDTDIEPLLKDMLSGGIYGTEDPDRTHSSNMTLDAVAASRKGRKSRGIWQSLFPGKAYLQSKYLYAKKYPILLLAAWMQRLLQYLKNSSKRKGSPAKSIQIGQARIELLKIYKII